MLFTSSLFLFFFLPILLALHVIMRKDFVNVLLLTASLFFYAWGEQFYILLLILSTLLNYALGLLIQQYREQIAGRWMLAGAVAVNLGLLGFYKYSNFLVDNLNLLLAPLDLGAVILEPVHLPIGISFFTFQALSYLVDVYRKTNEAQRDPIKLGLYITFFPQLIAGPIVRYHDIAAQLNNRVVHLEDFAIGIQRFIIGLGKKMLIANPLGAIADQIFGLPGEELTTGLAWLGILCYTLQIYFDFSGYSDMAIGLARMFGFRFLENFNYPYISQSIQAFWRRWHISLSNWFRDYLYIPLGGNRCAPWRVYLNLWIVFLLCGLWHGASWNFVIWGALHGLFLVIERSGFGAVLSRLPQVLRHLYVLLLVMLAWVFFRAETLPQALTYLQAMAGFGQGSGLAHYVGLYTTDETWLLLAIGMIAATPILPWLTQHLESLRARCAPLPGMLLDAGVSVISLGALAFILMSSASATAAGTYNPFIYFRF